MQVLKLKLYQNLCNYKREGSFGYVQTYPLPTPSMVRGMIHDIAEWEEYHPLKISIQGESDATITNVQRVYKFDRDPRSRPDNPYVVIVKESTKTATHGILFIDLIVNIRLILHIQFENENEKRSKELYNKIQQKVVILGRNEDIALVEDLRIVELEKVTEGRGSVSSKLPMYVSPEVLIENSGTRYRLPFWYDKVENFDQNRIFHFIDAYYIGKGVELRREQIFKDEEGDIVSFLESPNG